jgi:hypothetical protein
VNLQLLSTLFTLAHPGFSRLNGLFNGGAEACLGWEDILFAYQLDQIGFLQLLQDMFV